MKRIISLVISVVLLVSALGIVVFAGEEKPMSDEFKSILNEEGKLELNAPKPEAMYNNDIVAEKIVDFFYSKLGYSASYDGWADDLSTCWLYNSELEEDHQVEVEFTYDGSYDDIKEYVESKVPKETYLFSINDFEMVNMWVNNPSLKEIIDKNDGGSSLVEYGTSMINYSGELKSLFDNKNIGLYFHSMKGEISYACHTSSKGIALFHYNGTIFYQDDHFGTDFKQILYVPDDTGDSKEELMAAIQTRFDEYLGEGEVEVKYGSNNPVDVCLFQDVFYQQKLDNLADLNSQLKNAASQPEIDDLKGQISELEQSISDYIKMEKEYVDNWASYLKDFAGGHWFYVNIKGFDYAFGLMKDSSKMIYPEFKSVDYGTDVEVITDDSSVPLDTLVAVDKVNRGEKYQKIIDRLKLKDEASATYEISLYSRSKDAQVTKLENGQFEVRIPINAKQNPDLMKMKELTAYYVDENNKIIEYPVTVKDGYGIFYTNHFSTYTLAEAKETVEETPEEKPAVDNPPTGDINTVLVFAAIVVSVMGAAVVIGKKAYNKK